ncbi:hypothetical protein scyTo_0021532, partial [Scyliorhinus torazame]|nr:hypothetical protein [Scyliorhinus torazame]
WFPAKFVEVLDERSKEAAGKEVERDFDSVYSRLVLCKTYRLDEDGKVLTPEELLYRVSAGAKGGVRMRAGGGAESWSQG